MPSTPPRTRIPLATASAGHLRVRRGLDAARLTADLDLPDLLHGWWRREPQVTADDGVVTLTFPRRWRLARWGIDELVLNASIPWDMSIEGGVHRVTADFRALKLRSLTIGGGASRFTLVLGPPEGEVQIDLRSVERVTIRRPATTQVRVRVTKGATQVAVDDQTYGAIGGETVLTTGPMIKTGYHVNVDGANRLRVATN